MEICADDTMERRRELEQERRQLQARLAKIEAELSAPSGASNGKARSAGKGIGRSIRDLVLDCLYDIGIMSYSQQLAIFASARYGREIPSARFGTLSRDEERAARSSRPREVWLCHGLTYDRAEPIRRLWARSDWPLEDRIVAPTTSRVLYLWMTARLAELAMRDEERAADAEMLKYLAADNARDLGLPFRRGEFPLEGWRESALAQLREIEEEDRQSRMEAAERLSRTLPPFSQLFGRPPMPVALPGGAAAREA